MNTYYTNLQKETARQKRQSHIDNGKIKASENELLHIKGCILYWAEGDKSKNLFGFTNCDVEAHRIMVSFLRCYFPEISKKLKARIAFYPGGKPYEEIKKFWSEELNIPSECFNKATDRSKYYSTPKVNKYPNGVLQLQLSSTEVVNHIFGAVNHYVGKDIYNATTFQH